MDDLDDGILWILGPRIKPMRFRYMRQTNLIGFFVLKYVAGSCVVGGRTPTTAAFFVCNAD